MTSTRSSTPDTLTTKRIPVALGASGDDLPSDAKEKRALTSRIEDCVLFVLVLLPGLALAHVLAFDLRIHEGDALSRTYQAASVLYSNPPRLANIGFIWTPLPTLVQIPLVAIRLLALNGFSGQIASVLFAAGSLVVLNRLMCPFLPQRAWRYPVLAIYQFNPLILIYSVNGMSESMLIFWVLLGVYGLMDVAQSSTNSSLTRSVAVMGGAAAMAFLTRYEGASFGIILGLALILVTTRHLTRDVVRLEGILLTYVVPWAYAVFLWLFFNWMIMGNPFYFMVGRGSNRDQSAVLLSGNQQIASLQHNLPNASLYVGNLLLFMYPAFFVVMVLLLVLAWRTHDRRALALLAITASFPVFQVGMHYYGLSFGWLRFHIYVVPLTILCASYFVHAINRYRFLARAGITALLLVSSVVTVFALDEPSIQSYNEGDYYRALAGHKLIDNFAPEREMASYMKTLVEQQPGVRILVDELRGDALIILTESIENFVGSRDQNFLDYIAHPIGNVDYLLASDVKDGSDLVAASVPLDRPLPEYLELVHQTKGGQWRLYRVIDPTDGPSATTMDRTSAPSASGR
jgi:hypothetical protein